MWRVLDWLDEFSGYDRRGIRALLVYLLIVPALIAAEWLLTAVL